MTQAEKIYEVLAEAGEQGVTNIDLNKICFRYGARLKDMRDKGIVIKSVHIKGPIWRFYLVEPEETLEELFDERMEHYEYEQSNLFDMLEAS